MQEIRSNIELDEATNTISEVIFENSDAVHHTVTEVRELQQSKLNRDGQYHIQPYKAGILHTFKGGSIWIQVLTISLTVRSTDVSSTVTSYIFWLLFAYIQGVPGGMSQTPGECPLC